MKDVGKCLLRASGNAAIGFGSSLLGSGAGKIVSSGIEKQGASLILRGKVKACCFTKADAQNLVVLGKRLVNTSRGISSVTGTVFVWPTATALSYPLS